MTELKFITLIITCILISSCEVKLFDCLDPEGPDVERILTIDETINEIKLDVPVDLIVSQGTLQEIRLEGAANLLDAMERDSRTEGDEFVVDIDGCSDSDGIRMFAQLTSLEKLTINGSGSIFIENAFNNIDELELLIKGSGNITCTSDIADELKAKIEGSGFIQLDGNKVRKAEHIIEGSGRIDFNYQDATEVIALIEGSGKITGSGITNSIDLKIEGSGQLLMKNILAQDAKAVIKGSGRIELAVESNLEAKIDGSGIICYVGQPTLQRDIKGSGDIRACD